jgi:hypothetical protein
LASTKTEVVIVRGIEVAIMGKNALSAAVPERANAGSKTQFSTDNQPEKRGRPRGSRNKMSRALREMIVEVAEELGRVDPKDWDKLLCGDDDGVKGVLKVLAVREPATFGNADMSLYSTSETSLCLPQANAGTMSRASPPPSWRHRERQSSRRKTTGWR